MLRLTNIINLQIGLVIVFKQVSATKFSIFNTIKWQI